MGYTRTMTNSADGRRRWRSSGRRRMRLKVGVIGCGLIAQVMHLHYLRELAEQFEIAALCDVSDEVRAACARDYGVRAHLRRLARADRDGPRRGAGAHLRQPCADRHRRGRCGKHVLVEKPMCFSVAEGQAMIARSGARRGDADGRLQQALRPGVSPAAGRGEGTLRDLRLARVTTLESPFQPYVAHYRLHRAAAPSATSRHASRPTMRLASPRPSATPIRCRAAPIIWCCSIPWCTSSMRSAACWASRIGWNSPTSANTA